MYLNRFTGAQLNYIARQFLQSHQLTQTLAQFCSWRTLRALRESESQREWQRRPAPSLKMQRAQKRYSTTQPASSAPNKEDTKTAAGAESEEVDGVDNDESIFSLKSLLYDERKDALMAQLNGSKDHVQLLATIALEDSKGQFERQHLVQSIILLWTFCRKAKPSTQTAILTDPALAQLLRRVMSCLASLDADEMSCCYLYLRKMGVPNTEPAVQRLLQEALDLVASGVPLPLTALSRLVVGINTGYDFHVPIVCREFMPHIQQHIATCTTDEEARLLAVCVLHMKSLISSEMLAAFKHRIHSLLQSGILNAQTPKAIAKLIHALNLPRWSQLNLPLMRDLLVAVSTNLDALSPIELKTICRCFQHHMEPAMLAEPLMRTTHGLLKQQLTPLALTCYMPFAQPSRREPLVAQFKQLLASSECWRLPHASADLFAVLRALKISDVRMCDAYWVGVMCEIDDRPGERGQQRFLRHAHRYMNFNNNLGGTYRCLPLERKLSAMAMHAIEHEVAGRIPQQLARLAAFVLAYGHTPLCWKKFPNVILSKVIAMADQFSAADVYVLSRGLQIAKELRFRQNTPSPLGMQLATLEAILLGCAERQLRNESLTLDELNGIVRSLGQRKSLKNTSVYHAAFNKFKKVDYAELNTRSIREMSYNFSASNMLVPAAMDAMFEYIEHNQEHIMGDTVEKVLSCAYSLGYTPQSLDVLDYAALILQRDFNYMSSLSLVQACLALCFYKTIPDELINRVFCIKFIQRIEEEIQMCYSKATYPERVLNLVMQLNRTVCLDFPEANVPWFQQNYIESQLSKKRLTHSRFGEDIKGLLQTVLKDETYFRCNHTTPYGYQIDFVIHFDRDKRQPIAAPVETTMLDRITKVAILLLRLDSYCANDLTALRGPDSLKIKHLEMMGYKVLHVNEHDWNSKYMNSPGAKEKYLRCLLQIKN